jgi:SSS family solute:Na+ symporter
VSTWLIAVVLVFSMLQAPQAATFALGAFTRRISGRGAFAGLIAGVVVALLHHGLTLPVGVHAGLSGGWITVIHRYPGVLAQSGYIVAFSFLANLCVAWAESQSARARSEAEIKTRKRQLTFSGPAKARWNRPEILAALVMLVTLLLALVFA